MTNYRTRGRNVSVLMVLCFVLVYAIREIHLMPVSQSMFNEAALQTAIDYHRDLPVFAARPLTTAIVEMMSAWFHCSEPVAFVQLNLFLLWLSGVLLYVLSMRWGGSNRGAIIAVVSYYFCFSNIFAFFPPIYTYDEPLQFSLILSAMLWLPSPCFETDNHLLQTTENKHAIKSVPGYVDILKFFLFGLLLGLSFVCRETGVVILPAVFFVYGFFPHGLSIRLFQEHRNRLLIFGIAISLLMVWFWKQQWLIKHPLAASDQGLWQVEARIKNLSQNFYDSTYTLETISGFLLVLTLPFVLSWRVLFTNKLVFTGILISILINTAVVLTMAKAREARLFALPLLMVWPMISLVRHSFRKPARNSITIPVLLSGISLSIYFSLYAYTGTILTATYEFFKIYILIYCIVILILLLTLNFSKQSLKLP